MNNTYCRNGSRPQGGALAYKIVRNISGMFLAMAFKRVHGAGFTMRVVRLDGCTISPAGTGDQQRINVIVSEGSVKSAWVG